MQTDKSSVRHVWKQAEIGSVGVVTVGGTPSTAVPAFWNGTVPWMVSGDVHLKRVSDVHGRISDKGLENSNARLVDPPAVAIGLAGQGKTRGTAAITLIRLCTNQSVALIKGDEKELSTAYLYHILDFRYEELRSRSLGGGRAGLTKGVLEKIHIPFPEIDEQIAVAEILDTVDEAIRQTAAVIEKLKKIKAGLAHDLLTLGLNRNRQLRDFIHHPGNFKDSPLGNVPKDWEIIRCQHVMKLNSGKAKTRKQLVAEEGNIPVYGGNGIT